VSLTTPSGKTAPRRRAVIATAGHVDHGKTALIRALTGTDTDRLPEEKRRGITIELGFAELGGTGVSFIDVPGHRKLVHAMIAGASGVDAIVLVVAADDGVMPQTREHLHVAELLGIARVLVVLTKADLVDDETLALAEADVREALSASNIEPAGVVRTSTVTGLGVDAVRDAVETLANALPAAERTARAFLPIDRVFNVKGAGTVVTGTLSRGRLSVGAELHVHGALGSRAGTCRGLEIHGRAAEHVDAPSRVAVNLGRLGKDDVRRGDVLSLESNLPLSSRFDVALRLLSTEEPLADGDPAVVHIGTARAAARITRLEEGLAHLTLEEPLVALGGLGFVLRGFTTSRDRGAVLGGGRVLDALAAPLPPRRDTVARAARTHIAELLRDGRFRDAVAETLNASPRPLDGGLLESRVGLEPGTVTMWFGRANAEDVVTVDGGRSWTTGRVLERLAETAVRLVEAHHAEAAHERGASLETVRATLAEGCGREAAEAALQRAVVTKRLEVVDQGVVRTPAFAASHEKAFDGIAKAVLSALERARFEGREDANVAAEAGGAPEAVRAALGRLAATGRARRLGGLWFAEAALDALRDALRERFRRGATLTVADFKELTGVSRKQAIPLLEQLDREGSTRREGDVRLAGPRLRE
jgi:selenocysteine-specific elongation factor